MPTKLLQYLSVILDGAGFDLYGLLHRHVQFEHLARQFLWHSVLPLSVHLLRLCAGFQFVAQCHLAYQLHKMLYCSKRAVRYYPPTRSRVTCHSLSVYAWSAFVASWGTWGPHSNWWPIRNGLYSGILCLPMPYDTTSVIFFYAVFAPCVFLIPLVYICYLTYDIFRNQLLPPLRQRKTLMIFFRLVLVYFVFWLPAIIIVFIGSNWLSSWWNSAGALWAHFQGAISALVCLVKPDIWNASKRLYYCCNADGNKKDNALENTEPSVHSRSLFLGFAESDDEEDNLVQSQRVIELDNIRSQSFLGFEAGDNTIIGKEEGMEPTETDRIDFDEIHPQPYLSDDGDDDEEDSLEQGQRKSTVSDGKTSKAIDFCGRVH